MFAEVCVKYLNIAKTQVKLTLRMNLLLAVTVLFITPVIFGVNNLDNTASAFVLERFVSLTGIIILTPVFLPEQDKNIFELVESKYTPITGIYLIRFILAAVSLLFLISGFIFIMILMSCEFDIFKFIFGTFATAFFLGALGFIAYAISDNIIAGYSLSLGYYVFNMLSSSENLKKFYLFTLGQNRLNEKYWLFGIGTLFIIAGIFYKYILKKTR